MASEQSTVGVGTTAPAFTLETNTGSVDLASYHDRRNVVLYFMREFHCPICQQHVVRLARIFPDLQAQGTEVVVIGGGTLEEAERLAHRLRTPFPVAADPDRTVYDRYGLQKTLGLIQRSGAVLVDRAGMIRYVNRATLPTGSLDEAALRAAIAGVTPLEMAGATSHA